ncbi:unnamed protein product [Caenorhabditis brenneri]
MSLSCPIKFPLLKLPWLCIRCVIQNSDLFDIIYFATISNKTRRIVRSSDYPSQELDVDTNRSSICMGKGKSWYFVDYKCGYGVPLVLKRNSQPLPTMAIFVNISSYLHSYTAGDKLDALKMGIEFMIDVFGCTIRNLFLERIKISKLNKLGTMSVKKLVIGDGRPVYKNYLNYVLENIKVTDEWVFNARVIPANFSCDPRIFKCRRLSFPYRKSADWVTLELLCQFDVSQLTFRYHRFSVEDIVSYVTHWFNSENRKLEYLYVFFNYSVSLEDLKIEHFNPMPFCEKRRSRWGLHEPWWKTDMSSGMDIVRQDGLLATLYAFPTSILFNVWHKRFPDAVCVHK